jgi:hypothetical protein
MEVGIHANDVGVVEPAVDLHLPLELAHSALLNESLLGHLLEHQALAAPGLHDLEHLACAGAEGM